MISQNPIGESGKGRNCVSEGGEEEKVKIHPNTFLQKEALCFLAIFINLLKSTFNLPFSKGGLDEFPDVRPIKTRIKKMKNI